MRRLKKCTATLLGTLFILTAGQTAAYAGTWTQAENGAYQYINDDGSRASGWLESDGKWYYLDESGWMKTGWIEDQDRWYYLSESTGEWIPAPPINEKTAAHLVENALADAGLFQDEENLDVRVSSVTKTTVTVTVGVIDRPQSFRGFAQYNIDRKTRKAEDSYGREGFKV